MEVEFEFTNKNNENNMEIEDEKIYYMFEGSNNFATEEYEITCTHENES